MYESAPLSIPLILAESSVRAVSKTKGMWLKLRALKKSPFLRTKTEKCYDL